MRLKLFLTTAFILVTACSCSQENQNAHIQIKRSLKSSPTEIDRPALPKNVIPISYDVYLQPFPNDRYFKGRVEVNISCIVPTKTITLNAGENLQITSAEVSEIKPTNNNKHYGELKTMSVQRVQRGSVQDWCEVNLSEEMQIHTHYKLVMEFSGTMGSNSSYDGIYTDKYTEEEEDERWYVTASMMQNNARKVFPCFDELEYKALFKIIVGRPEKMSSLSNMALEKSEKITDQDGWVWDHFKRSPPISTFSVIFIVFDPTVIVPVEINDKLGSTTLHVYGQPHMVEKLKKLSEVLIYVIQRIETYLRTKYPLPDFQVLVIPNFQSSCDAFGMKLLRESILDRDFWQFPVLSNLADQWMIHLTTPYSWSDTNFTKFMVEYIGIITFLDSLQQFKYKENVCLGPPLQYTLTENSLIGDSMGNTFDKSFWLFRMLTNTLSENTIRSGINSFIFDKSYKTYSSDEVLTALNEQSRRDLALPPDVSVSQFTKSWLKSFRYPVITVFRDYKTGSAQIEQKIFIRDEPQNLTETEKNFLWFVPLVLVSGENPEKQDLVAWMKEERTVTLRGLPNARTFIIINPDHMGKFVVNYDPTNWALLTDYLQNNATSLKVSPLTRGKLISDAFLLADAGQLTFDTMLDLTLMLRDETAVDPWLAYSEVARRMIKKLTSTKTLTLFEDYVRMLTSPIYEQYGGYSDAFDEYDCKLENTLQRIMCETGTEDCIEAFAARYTTANASQCSFCKVLKFGPRDLWDETLLVGLGHNDERHVDVRKLTALASCTRDQDRLEKLLDAVLLKYAISSDDMLDTIDNITNSYVLFNYISDHWSEIKKRYGKKQDLLESLVFKSASKFVTSDGYEIVSKFYTAHQRDSPKISPVLRKALEEIVKNSEWYERSLPQIETWLQRFFANIN